MKNTNRISKYHNTLLEDSVKDLRDIMKDAKLYFADIYRVHREVFRMPSDYGIHFTFGSISLSRIGHFLSRACLQSSFQLPLALKALVSILNLLSPFALHRSWVQVDLNRNNILKNSMQASRTLWEHAADTVVLTITTTRQLAGTSDRTMVSQLTWDDRAYFLLRLLTGMAFTLQPEWTWLQRQHYFLESISHRRAASGACLTRAIGIDWRHTQNSCTLSFDILSSTMNWSAYFQLQSSSQLQCFHAF